MKVSTAVCIFHNSKAGEEEIICHMGKGGLLNISLLNRRKLLSLNIVGNTSECRLPLGMQEYRLKLLSVKVQVCCFTCIYIRALANIGILAGDHACGTASRHLWPELGLSKSFSATEVCHWLLFCGI